MSSLDSIVNVTISSSAGIVSRQGFGIPLIMGTNGVFGAGTLRSYASLAAVLADFANTTPEYKMAAAIFSQNPYPPLIKIGVYSTAGQHTLVGDIEAIELLDNDFYYVLCTDRAKADILLLAAHIQTTKKIFFALTLDADVPIATAGNVALTLQTAKYTRTAIIYTPTDQYQDAAWVGLMAPKNPGSANWMFKQVSGITPDADNDTVVTNLKATNCNFYTAVAGINMFQKGVVASGEYIDIVQGTDWIQVNLQADIFQGLVDVDKIPFTNAGGDVFRSIISARLKQAISVGILTNSPAPVIVVPDVSTISTNDKANRNFTGITFTAFYAGAVNAVTMNGYLSI